MICNVPQWRIFVLQVAIADHDGILTCFGMKKGEAVVGLGFTDSSFTSPAVSKETLISACV